MKKIYAILLWMACTTGSIAQTPAYEFSFTGGTLIDDTGATSFSVVSDGTARIPINDRAGNANNALQMNNDKLVYSPTVTSNVSVSFYMKTTATGGPRLLVSDRASGAAAGMGYSLAMNDGKLEVYSEMNVIDNFGTQVINQNFNSGVAVVNDGNWHHIVLVAEKYQIQNNVGYNFYVYIDGSLDSQPQLNFSTAGQPLASLQDIVNGTFSVANYVVSTGKFNDAIDDIKYYTQALTQAEVTALYNTVLNGEVTVANPIPDFAVQPGFVETIGLSTSFNDANGDVLSYTVSSSNETSVGASMVDATTFYIYDNDITNFGPVTITVTASDGNGSTATDEFEVAIAVCTVSIPDANFKAYLSGNLAINTNGDGEIQCDEATAFTGTIQANGLGITDFTGLEAFVNITSLHAYDNTVGVLDVSANTALTYLDCHHTAIDELDVSNNTALTGLFCHENSLTSLDISNNTALTSVYIYDNEITELTLGANTALTEIRAHVNSLSSLDVSGLTALNYLDCSMNTLTSLNVSNGNNANFTVFKATTNPDLECVQVDDADNWTTNKSEAIDATAQYSEDCSASVNSAPLLPEISDQIIEAGSLLSFGIQATDADDDGLTFDLSGDVVLGMSYASDAGLCTFTWTPSADDIGDHALTFTVSDGNGGSISQSFNITVTDVSCVITIPDANFKSVLVANASINTNGDSEIQCDEAEAFSGQIDVYNQSITDLTGIEAFVNLTSLYCNYNSLTALNLSANTALNVLYCDHNQITSLDLSALTSLTYFNGRNNNLNYLNLANGNNTNFLICTASSNSSLTCVQVDDVDYSTTNWTSGNFSFNGGVSFSLDCDATNSNPVLAEIGNQTVDAGDLLSFSVQATDPDGDELTFDLTGDIILGMSYTSDAGLCTFTWTPSAADAGDHALTFTVTDGNGGSASQNFTITVTDSGCDITDVSVGAISACNELNDAYTVELTVIYSGAPTDGTLVVNGINFSISGSPQTVQINDVADGNVKDLNVYFSSDESCSYTQTAAWTAPAACSTPACDLTNIDILATSCESETTYRAQMVVYYSNAPGTGTMQLIADGQSFDVDITGSPQNVTLSGLPVSSSSEGASVNLEVSFTEDTECSYYLDQAWFAPGVEACLNNNTTPVLDAIGNKTIEAGAVLTFTATATDAEGDELYYDLNFEEEVNTAMTIDESTGVFVWATTSEDIGEHTVTISVGDDFGSDGETITITVTAPAITVLGADDLKSKELSVYPNPAIDVIGVDLKTSSEIQIVNLSGKSMYSIPGKAGTNVLNVSELPSGVYLLKITNKKGMVMSEKLIKK